MLNKTDMSPCLSGVSILVGKTKQKRKLTNEIIIVVKWQEGNKAKVENNKVRTIMLFIIVRTGLSQEVTFN